MYNHFQFIPWFPKSCGVDQFYLISYSFFLIASLIESIELQDLIVIDLSLIFKIIQF